jgi:dUTP pyrophosphatase
MDFDYLYIYTNNNELKINYTNHVINHNKQVNTEYPNAGFDLLSPTEVIVSGTKFVLDTELICCMKSYDNKNLSYYLYPRSSIIKTPFRLANSVGIIDSGYRGNIKACFDVIISERYELVQYEVTQYSRLVQLCSPTLKPLIVKIVDNIEELGLSERGSGGFGSTGI